MKKNNFNIKQMNDFKTFCKNLPVIVNYLNLTKVYFKDLDKTLSNVDLSDKDKLVMINNQYKEFESEVLKNGISL